MNFQFDAYVTEALFDGANAAFALGDGTVRWDDGSRVDAHEGTALCAVRHPTGDGVVSGGDDGAVVWSRRSGPQRLAEAKGRWIDAVATSPEQGLIAFSFGKEARIIDAKDPAFQRRFTHEASVAGLAFEPKGRRLAAATYGGAALWYARIAEQKPVMLRWAGSHIGVTFSPDGRFLMSAMQENALHGWRLNDAKDMRMGGYPSKVKSIAFLEGGRWLATAGAGGVVLWPFMGTNGPMGKEAMEIGAQDGGSLVTRVAAAPDAAVLAAGLDDGRVWACDIATQRVEMLKADKGPPITALAVLGRERLAWGDEGGGAGVLDLPALR